VALTAASFTATRGADRNGYFGALGRDGFRGWCYDKIPAHGTSDFPRLPRHHERSEKGVQRCINLRIGETEIQRWA
jgi:hypothetical protein